MTVTYPSQTKTRLVKDAGQVKLLKAVVEGASADKLAGIIYRDDAFRPVLNKLACQKLSQECTSLCSDKQPSVLRNTAVDDLTNISWKAITEEWKQRSTLLYEVLEAIACKQPVKERTSSDIRRQHIPRIGFAGSALLFSRNPKMCQLQLAAGLVLDKGGATDEVCKSHV